MKDAIALLLAAALITGCSQAENPELERIRAGYVKSGDVVAWLKTKPLKDCDDRFINAKLDNTTVTVISKAPSGIFTKAADSRFLMAYDTECFVTGIFKDFPKIQKVMTRFDADLIDERGHSHTGIISRFTFTRENSATINWDRVRVDRIARIADDHWENPVIDTLDEK